ncbi:cytochrome c biogenesis protein ResB [Brevibacillus sp. SYP-B805]|uniref:cytochrome c biogenesis protein ResB n=1 Tax=Brevibacillus sp. SYP-B805 TaxID=1578199 RepID=UPI0013E9D81A|nr:cytochrome c biogenesis protein ResB [Brevibacillus sp. SYP-B805]NGQ94626.1 cytochrome c biogenesis protein ResB [Brevibacillus sp. SYP-B805]
MDVRKCECGHTNPVGTMLCESCGKPVDFQESGQPEQAAFPDMRYEGMARRSQTYSRTIIDRIWNFFSSVKIAIALILITLIASAVGTIFPQQDYIPVPVSTEADIARFYGETYGKIGEIYYALGFHNLYSSWWFKTLLVFIGTSLVICSLDRVIPLYKALSRPRLNQHLSFLKGQKLYGNSPEEASIDPAAALPAAADFLARKGYRLFREENALLAEKARFSRWGPYINHIGLIIFLFGVLLRSIPGFYLDQFVWVREGQTVSIPETPYYVKNVAYKTEYWDESEMPEKLNLNGGAIPKTYQTDAVLYVNKNADLPGAKPELAEVAKGPILVNHPMIYEDLAIYQSGVKEMELGALNFAVLDRKAGNKQVGSLKLDLYAPQTEQQVAEGITVRVLDYFPDFVMGNDGKPATKTNQPNNPMFALEIASAEGVKEKLVYVSGTVISDSKDPRYALEVKMPDFIDISGLMVRKDKAVPVIYFGALIFMVGVVMGTYWQHRRIWVQWENGRLHLAGHTNKNWFGLRKEMELLIAKMNWPVTLVQKGKS